MFVSNGRARLLGRLAYDGGFEWKDRMTSWKPSLDDSTFYDHRSGRLEDSTATASDAFPTCYPSHVLADYRRAAGDQRRARVVGWLLSEIPLDENQGCGGKELVDKGSHFELVAWQSR